jgi:hypothetical protein
MNTSTQLQTHSPAPEEIMAFADGEMTGMLREFTGGHVAECKECQQVEENLRQTSQLLRGWHVEPLPAPVEIKVREAALAGGLRRRRMLPRLPVWSRWALATGLAVVVVIFIVGQRREGDLSYRQTMPTPIAKTEEQSSLPTVDSRSKVDVLQQAKRNYEQALEMKQRQMLSASLENEKAYENREGGGGGGDESAENSKELTLPAPAPLPQPLPMIARTVSLSIVVKDFAAARGTLDAILVRHHGYSAELTVNTAEGSPRTLQASLRVPAPELMAAMVELKALGRVENETQSGEEVTQQHADLVARLKNSRETEQRMQAILQQRTGKLSDVLEVEQEIAQVRGEIEQMEAEQKSLEHRVEFATVNLNLADVYQAQLNAPSSTGTRLHNGFVAGYHNAAETLLGIALFIMEAGPSLLIWLMILGLPVVYVWRRYRRSLAAI